jgi:hypothetical protein
LVKKIEGILGVKDLTVSFHLGKTSSHPATVNIVEQKIWAKMFLK